MATELYRNVSTASYHEIFEDLIGIARLQASDIDLAARTINGKFPRLALLAACAMKYDVVDGDSMPTNRYQAR